MVRYEHLPIYKQAMEVAVYFEKIVAGFSRYHKYTLGTELRNKSREAGASRRMRCCFRWGGLSSSMMWEKAELRNSLAWNPCGQIRAGRGTASPFSKLTGMCRDCWTRDLM